MPAKNPFEFKPTSKKIRKTKDLSFEESFLDSQVAEPEVMDDERYRPNLNLLGLILILCFGLILGRIYFLQAVRGEEFRNLAEGNKLRTNYVIAPRGLILDKTGKVIAGNIPSFELVANPSGFPKDEAELKSNISEVAAIINEDPAEIEKIIASSRQDNLGFLTIAQNISKEQALILMSRQDSFEGFVVENNPIREYKDPLVFSHLVGYTGKITRGELEEHAGENYLLNDNIGKTGLEIYYERFLRGIPGRKQIEIDARGSFRKTLPEVPAVAGSNLKLNLDYELETVLYEALTDIMKRGSAKKAAAIATEPATGKVLAYISLPSFDNNWFARGISTSEYESLINDKNIPLLNRVIAGAYPPGSTVKPMLAVAALTEGVVTPETKILDDGVIHVGNFTFYGYDRSGLGLMDIYSAIARSSDIYFYTVGGGNAKTSIRGLGPEKLAEWYRKFGLGQPLGIDLQNEKGGLVPDPEWKLKTRNEQWYLGNTYHYSIGQGDLLVTPLQVNSWTATIANGGKLMRPYIVDEIEGVEKKTPVVLKENFLDSKWVRVVQDGMRQAVTAGSARSLDSLSISIAGKTGTAQFDARNPSRTHAWFTSYAPFEDPKIALTILVESGGEGSSVAVPVARQVYEWWAEHR
ncbi:MAG: penicillin-binding protein 2 [Candidatus Doudnabacteria bacterium]|nr:penicillin-binding protein 2 [Candidatus Doudnabacteria bacterium]